MKKFYGYSIYSSVTDNVASFRIIFIWYFIHSYRSVWVRMTLQFCSLLGISHVTIAVCLLLLSLSVCSLGLCCATVALWPESNKW